MDNVGESQADELVYSSGEIIFEPEIEQLIVQLKLAITESTPMDREDYARAITWLDGKITALLETHTNIYCVGTVKCIHTIGDTHGSVDLLAIFNHLKPNDDSHVIFMGDYVDRGSYSLENLLLILFLKLKYPNSVHVLRGNHEDEDICSSYRQVGFRYECERKLPRAGFSAKWDKLMDFFAHMPWACIANGNFYVHGGLPMGSAGKIMDFHSVNMIERKHLRTLPPPIDDNNQCVVQMLWGDPRAKFGTSDRGADTFVFGPKETMEFFEVYSEYELKCVVRAHEVQTDGYIINHQDEVGNPICVTVFSASRYCGGTNSGAIYVLNPNGNITIISYKNKKELDDKIMEMEQVMEASTPRYRSEQ